jgi:hypothetical protein
VAGHWLKINDKKYEQQEKIEFQPKINRGTSSYLVSSVSSRFAARRSLVSNPSVNGAPTVGE